ncbi:MAG: hypothetical protein BWK80_57005 [Desulfobacteraceae bacterium IS3]|nr:MAG: hypothetical protein BWK80_57005 [Desulfobacteraceae bacterium IS3]
MTIYFFIFMRLHKNKKGIALSDALIVRHIQPMRIFFMLNSATRSSCYLRIIHGKFGKTLTSVKCYFLNRRL